jgi:hypothetical protein
MVPGLIASLKRRLTLADPGPATAFTPIDPSDIGDRARAETFFAYCAEATDPGTGLGKSSVPGAGSAQSRSHARLIAYQAMQRVLRESAVDSVADLPATDIQALALYAEAVQSDDQGFSRLLRRLDPGKHEVARHARAVWRDEQPPDRAEAVAPGPDGQPTDDPEDIDLEAIQAALVAPSGSMSPASGGGAPGLVPMPKGGLLEWIQTQTPAMWHELASNLDWTSVHADPRIVSVAHWIAMQQNCDRATAITLLARAVADRIDRTHHGHLDLSETQLLMSALHRNLSYGFYKCAELAPAASLGAEIFQLFRLHASDGPESRYALDPHVVGRLGTSQVSPPYRFDGSRVRSIGGPASDVP